MAEGGGGLVSRTRVAHGRKLTLASYLVTSMGLYTHSPHK